MDMKRLAIGTLVGGIIVRVVGYLIFTLAFGSVYAANIGATNGVARDPRIEWAIFVASFAYAALITVMIDVTGRRAITTGEAVKRGATVGFLLWVTADFTIYGSTNTQTLTITALDPVLELIRGGISGVIIGVLLSRVGSSRPRERHEAVGV